MTTDRDRARAGVPALAADVTDDSGGEIDDRSASHSESNGDRVEAIKREFDTLLADDRDPTEASRSNTVEPVLGIRAVPGTADEVAGTVLRARRAGYDVIVGYNDEELEAVSFAADMDARLLPVGDAASDAEIRRAFTQSARASGYPGVLYQEDPTVQLDFEQSVARLAESDAYLVDAVVQSTLEERPDLLVAIPAYNEANSIEAVVTGAREYADDVVVIDDGSADDTAAVAKRAGATVVQHPRNRGYGAALASAFAVARRDHAAKLVILDGDGQHRTSDITRLVDRQAATGCDLVIGSRLADGGDTDMPLYRRFGLGVINVLTNASMLGTDRPFGWIRDTQSGFRLYTEPVIESLASDPTIGRDMHASTDILYHAAREGYTVEEVGVSIRYDVAEANTKHPVTHGIGLVRNIVRTMERERPLALFGPPALTSISLGIGIGYATFATGMTSGTLPAGMFLVAGVLLMLGVFFGLAAMVSHYVNHRVLGDRDRDRVIDPTNTG